MLDKKYELNPCIEKIEKWFQFDTITLLDCVLTDDPLDPEYSANTVYYRLEEVVNFHKQYFGIIYSDVTDYLLNNGYSSEDVELLNQKRIEENQRHSL